MGLTLYKSSAGSGKTFTLVRLYLEKVIKHPRIFRSILAITFTNKATEEMKTRIIKELDILSNGRNSSHLSYLIDITKLSEDVIRKNAKEILLLILHDYSSFSVSTIDSYFQILARTLARELHLPVKYEIELDLDAICDAISTQLLSEAGRNKIITDWLQDLLAHKIDLGKSWNIIPDLKNTTKQILINNDAHQQAVNSNPDAIILLINELKKIRDNVENTLRSIGTEGVNSIAANNYSLESFSYGKTGAINFFYKISNKVITSASYEIGARVEKALEDPSSLISKANQKDEKLVSFATEIIHPLLCQALDFYKEEELRYLSACEVLKMIYLAGISGSLNEKLKGFRDEFQLFLLSDTTRMLREMVQDNDASFIYEKSGNTFKHLFIDEFQDTSSEQWQILKPLISNSLGEGNDVLLVGDAKQSIYRWRGGNMHLLLSGVKNEFASFASVTKELKLDTNYRSLENIVNFNNKFFSLAAQVMGTLNNSNPSLINQAYGIGEIEQQVKSDDAKGGMIELYFFDSPSNANKKAEGNSDNEAEETWKEKALIQLNSTIKNSIAQGYELRDIAILVRTRNHEKTISDFLLHHQEYDFIAPNSLMLSTNIQIRFLLNCLRLIHNGKNTFLQSEVNYFITKKLFLNKYEIPFDANKIKDDSTNWSNDVLLAKRYSLLSLPLDLAYYQLLQLSNLQKPDPFIDHFTDIILGFVSSNGTGIFEFLKWWDKNVETKNWSVEIPQATNAIRILSIHRSKGLQFPIVIIPFADWSIVPNIKSVLWFGTDVNPFNEMEKLPISPSQNLMKTVFAEDYITECEETYLDNLNLLYVAFTRAENQLHIFGSNKAKSGNVGSLILEALGSDNEWGALLNINDTKHILIGEPTVAKKKKEETTKNSLYNPSSKIAEALNVSSDKKASIPSLLVRYESDEIIFGNYVHSILSQIKNKLEITNAIHRLNIRHQLNADKLLLANLKQTVEQVWDLMDAKGWNDNSYLIKNEPELCDENGLSHRPDRVLLHEKKAIIIDFKTGITDDKYHQQVKLYASLLHKTGIEEIEAYLIYTASKMIEQVTL